MDLRLLQLEHIPNNMDYTITADNGQMVIAPSGGGCTLISANDPQIAAYRAQAGTAPPEPATSDLIHRD